MKKMSKSAKEDMKGLIQTAEGCAEVLILSIMYYVTWVRGYNLDAFLYRGKYVLMGIYALLLLAMFHNSDCTKFGQLNQEDLVIGQIISVLLVNFVTYLQLSLVANAVLRPTPLLVLTVVEILAAVLLIRVFVWVYYKLYAPHEMLLIYGSEQGVDLKIKMDGRKDKYNITALLSVEAGKDAIFQAIPQYDAVILNEVDAALRNDILKYCYGHRIRTYLAPKLTDLMIRYAREIPLFDTPLLLVKGTGLTPTQRIIKRTIDIALSALALLIFSPIMLAVAAAIKLEDGGPVFYKQKRLTRYEEEFEILKFRSMIVDAEKYQGAVLATDRDPRITKVGRVIRAARLDELPQLINILKGDMSIVGPRPERRVIAQEYYKDFPEFAYRLKVRGGLTGYAQIYGKYNTNPYDKLRLDLEYIENYSLMLDIKLMIMTLRIMFSKESTEGVDKAEETRKKAQELLHTQDYNKE